MRVSLFLFLCVLAIPNSAGALEVSQGADITSVISAMKAAGYPEQVLAMRFPSHAGVLFDIWAVDHGELAVGYSETTNKVKSIIYQLSDERPKAYRKTFVLRVIRFDTDSGKMEIQTERPKQ